MHQLVKNILDNNRVIPVVVINDLDLAEALAESLMCAGINVLEITLRTPNALKIIELLSKKYPNLVIGAGTILNAKDYKNAVASGAKFIVSPGFSVELHEEALKHNVGFLPGVVTPTEILSAYSYGYRSLKFYPSENFGGVKTLAGYKSIFQDVSFCPTGGITLSNAKDYFKLSNVKSIGCSYFVSQELINNKEFAQITKLASELLVWSSN